MEETKTTTPPAHEPPGEGIGFLESVYGVLFQPVATLRQLGTSGRVRWGLLVYALILLFDQVVVAATIGDPYWETVLGAWGTAAAGSLFIALFPIMIGITFAAVAVLHACAVLLGGRGHFPGFFTATAFAGLPMVFLSLLSFWDYLGGSLSNVIGTVLSLVVSLWILVLQVLAIRESHRVSTGRAVLIGLFPLAFLLGAVLWLVGWGIALLPNLFEVPKF